MDDEKRRKDDPKLLEEERKSILKASVVSLAEYERIRRPLAKRLQMRATALDKIVAKKRRKRGAKTSSEIFRDPEPCPDPVLGTDLLDEICEWIQRYVWVDEHAADAVALWVVLTWFLNETYYAPILALLSATKRSGKTHLMTLLRWIVRRGYPTSGPGITPAVLFRLNESAAPTILIDEGERLRSVHDRTLISLLNEGYRRGNFVARCAERTNEIQHFQAFGFRAIAAVGPLWDTLIDRSIMISMQRKPRGANLADFNGRTVEAEGKALARHIARWTLDNQKRFSQAETTAPRPAWLSDRACDNWSGLFAVATLAGSEWPARAERAAQQLSSTTGFDADRAEQLIHDVHRVFMDRGHPEAIQSSHLMEALNRIETSPWGDYRGGAGISTRKLAAMLKPFEVRPAQRRIARGKKIRGYWLIDLKGVFERYPAPEAGHAGQPPDDQEECTPSTGTVPPLCPNSEDEEKPHQDSDVPVVPVGDTEWEIK